MRSLLLVLPVLGLAPMACGGGDDDFDRLPARLIAARNEGIVELSLATGDERLLRPATDDALLREPAVSPDGVRLAYTRQIIAVVVPGEPFDAGSDVYVSNIDGSDARLVREHGERGELIGASSWLPDGDLIVSFQRFDGPTLVTGVERIDIESGARTPVIDDAFAASATPDGERIVFLRADDDFLHSLWIANIDGTDGRALLGRAQGFGSFHSPRLSPDGATLAVAAAELSEAGVSARGGRLMLGTDASASYNGLPADIWLLDIATDEPRLLADLDLDSPSLAWSSDGSLLFVLSGQGLIALDPSDGSQLSLAEGTFHGQLDWLASEPEG